MDVQRLRQVARRQHGCVTFAQAVAAGVGERRIERLVWQGEWTKLAPHVYTAAMTARLGAFEQRLRALTLSVSGVAFGRSAVTLYGLLPTPKQPEVLVERSMRNRQRAGVHSTRALPTSEVTTVRGIPATLPARSTIDAAASMPFDVTRRLVDAAVVRGLVTPAVLARRALELQNSKRPGCRNVLRALAEQHPELGRGAQRMGGRGPAALGLLPTPAAEREPPRHRRRPTPRPRRRVGRLVGRPRVRRVLAAFDSRGLR